MNSEEIADSLLIYLNGITFMCMYNKAYLYILIIVNEDIGV
jgi:hypothetical protein